VKSVAWRKRGSEALEASVQPGDSGAKIIAAFSSIPAGMAPARAPVSSSAANPNRAIRLIQILLRVVDERFGATRHRTLIEQCAESHNRFIEISSQQVRTIAMPYPGQHLHL
jgi:hypothetical protein